MSLPSSLKKCQKDPCDCHYIMNTFVSVPCDCHYLEYLRFITTVCGHCHSSHNTPVLTCQSPSIFVDVFYLVTMCTMYTIYVVTMYTLPMYTLSLVAMSTMCVVTSFTLAYRVFNLHVLRFCASSIFTCFSFMSFLKTSLHLRVGLPMFRCPPTAILHVVIATSSSVFPFT